MDGVVEIITGRGRRRRWSQQDKARIVAESNEPGSMNRAVAARHGVCESLVFTWRRQAREGLLGPALASPMFVPVQALASASTAVGPLEERPSPVSVSRSVGAPGLYPPGDDRLLGLRRAGDLSGARKSAVKIRGGLNGDHHRG